MGAYAVRRLLLVIPTLLVVYTITFVVMHATPGGPFDSVGDKPIAPAVKKNLERKYHLDQPLYKQYVYYLGNAVKGDFGPSYTQRNRNVLDIIKDFFPTSAKLGAVSLLIAVVAGVTLGVVAAVRANTVVDYATMFTAVIGISVPQFVTVSLLIYFLSLKVNLLPTNGWGGILDKRIIIPALALSFTPMAILARYTRASVLGVLRQDYVRTARAKGLKERAVLARHILRNALIPIATVAGVQFAFIVTGSFYVETGYNIPGIGSYFVTSATGRDYTVLMALTLLLAALVILANLVIDLVYALLDPRISYQ